MEIKFVSDDAQFGLEVSPSMLQDLVEVCGKAWPNETGGVLIGCYNYSHNLAYLSQIKQQRIDSRAGRTWFHRGSQGLRGLFAKLWNRPPELREYYLGEWHYHPGGEPVPSSQDCVQMQTIAQDTNWQCPEPLLIIVAGRPNRDWKLGVFVFRRDRSFLTLSISPGPHDISVFLF
jgi:integrative and conjugative element protein (TIGR02256 family)